MATRKSAWIFFGILVISAWVLGSSIQVGAETMNYKLYTYVVKAESVPVGDVDGHDLYSMTRRSFLVFENGEVATERGVLNGERTKESGASFLRYTTVTFSDGSTIVIKSQGTTAGPAVLIPTAAKRTDEIIRGTGRFEGIKGTGTTAIKFFPVEKDEAGARGIGEGSITYTRPSK
jgi:hypothetical protein